MGVQSAVYEIIHESLKNKSSSLSVTALCEIAGVSRSGYYNWVNSEDTRNKREGHDREDFELILEAYNFRGYKKGVLSINMRLLHTGIVMNPKKIRRLMHKFNLFCPIRKANCGTARPLIIAHADRWVWLSKSLFFGGVHP